MNQSGPSNPSDPASDPKKNTHPDIRCNAPGRIPESLINAAIDGELNEDIQREIARALQYDPVRKQELLDTSNAIHALQTPITAPDLTDAILIRADRHRRFIPATWRRHVRAGRMGIAAVLLLALMVVAGLQRLYPRLTTIASHPTPVLNIEEAIEQDTDEFASALTNEARVIYSSVANPIAGILKAPGRNDHRFEVAIQSAPVSSALAGDDTLSRGYLIGDFIGVGYGVASIYVRNEEEASFAASQSPLCVFGSSTMGTWAHASHSSSSVRVGGVSLRSTRAQRALVEFDVPSLP